MELLYERTISALQAWVFQNDFYLLNWEMLQDLRLEKIAFPLLRHRVPEAYREQALLKAKEIGVLDMMQSGELQRLERLFIKNSISYCPIKGADLAKRVWPDSALRTRCDLDVLIHPDDRQKAIQLLKQDGWHTPFKIFNDHHEAPMRRHDVTLELHFSLPHLENVALKEVWPSLKSVAFCRFQLPLEWNLLMLFNHSRNHRWYNGNQLLLDCGFLVKREGNPDWNLLHALAQRFETAPPSLLFRAFPDFFPAQMMPEEHFSEEELNAFRRVICSAPIDLKRGREKVMSEENRYSFVWWRERLRGMRPSVIRILTNNPRKHYFRLLAGYVHVFRLKFRTFRQLRHGSSDPQMTSRLKWEAAVERICSAQSKRVPLKKCKEQDRKSV